MTAPLAATLRRPASMDDGQWTWLRRVAATVDALRTAELHDPRLAVTIRQPWAELAMAGLKPVENRGWRPRRLTVPGPLWIHAAARPDPGWRDRLDDWLDRDDEPPLTPPGWTPDRVRDRAAWAVQAREARGALLGRVLLADVHEHWRCQHPDRVPFYPDDPSWTLTSCAPLTVDDGTHWLFAHPRRLSQPIPMPGRLGCWPLELKVDHG